MSVTATALMSDETCKIETVCATHSCASALVALSRYLEKAIKVLQRVHLGVAGHLSASSQCRDLAESIFYRHN